MIAQNGRSGKPLAEEELCVDSLIVIVLSVVAAILYLPSSILCMVLPRVTRLGERT